MPADPFHLAVLAAMILVAAVLYSSVGHGGASAYLAAMALLGVAPDEMKPAALVMNIVVALAGTVRFSAASLVPWQLLGPLLAGSIPAAFLGGYLKLPTQAHHLLVGAILIVAAARLWLPSRERPPRQPPRAPLLGGIGAGLGLVAGLTGVGGGIFLSPLMILCGWEGPRRTAGASAVFILLNSAAGLLGHVQAARTIPGGTALLAGVALAGGLYGSWLGAKRLAPVTLLRLLGVVLVIAGLKLLLTW